MRKLLIIALLIVGCLYAENPDDCWNLLENEKQDWIGSEWVTINKSTYSYDENNNLIELIRQDWIGSEWETIFRSTLIYNENNNLIEGISQNLIGSEWINHLRYTYTYNENNNLIEDISQYWIGSEWVTIYRFIYTYDENNNLIEWIGQDWISSEWENHLRYTYIYNENNNLIEFKYQDWGDSEWENDGRSTNYIYEVCNALSIDKEPTPQKYNINSIYPNPFNPTTTISFSIPEFGLTTITVYNINGRQLETLTNEVLSMGNYSINWNASDYPSGVYLIRMVSGEFTQTQKVVLVK